MFADYGDIVREELTAYNDEERNRMVSKSDGPRRPGSRSLFVDKKALYIRHE